MKAIIFATLIAFASTQMMVDNCTPYRNTLSDNLLNWEANFTAIVGRNLQAVKASKPVAPTMPTAHVKWSKTAPQQPAKPTALSAGQLSLAGKFNKRSTFLADTKGNFDVTGCETKCQGKKVQSKTRILQAVNPTPPAGLATTCSTALAAACAASYTTIAWPARVLQAVESKSSGSASFGVSVDASGFADAMNDAGSAIADAATTAANATADMANDLAAGLSGGINISAGGSTSGSSSAGLSGGVSISGGASGSGSATGSDKQTTGCTDVASCAWLQTAIGTRVALATQLDVMNNKGCTEIPTTTRRLTLWGAKGRILQSMVPTVTVKAAGDVSPSSWVSKYDGNGFFCSTDFWTNLETTMKQWSEKVAGAGKMQAAYDAKSAYTVAFQKWTGLNTTWNTNMNAYRSSKTSWDAEEKTYKSKMDAYNVSLKAYKTKLAAWEKSNSGTKPSGSGSASGSGSISIDISVKGDTTTNYAANWGKKDSNGKWEFNNSKSDAASYNSDCKAKWSTVKTFCKSAAGPTYVDVPTLVKSVNTMLTGSGLDAASCYAKVIAAFAVLIAAMFY